MLQIQLQYLAPGARAADQEMRLARGLGEDRIAVIGLAGEITGHAGAAITQLAGGAGLDAVPAQHIDDGLADRHLVFPAAPREPHPERPVVLQPRRRRRAGPRKIFAMYAIARPMR